MNSITKSEHEKLAKKQQKHKKGTLGSGIQW